MGLLCCDSLSKEHSVRTQLCASPPGFVDSFTLESDSVVKCYLPHHCLHTPYSKSCLLMLEIILSRNGILDKAENEMWGLLAQASYKEKFL